MPELRVRTTGSTRPLTRREMARLAFNTVVSQGRRYLKRNRGRAMIAAGSVGASHAYYSRDSSDMRPASKKQKATVRYIGNDGVGKGRKLKNKRSRRRVKKTLKQRLDAIEKQKPKASFKKYIKTRLYKVPILSNGSIRLFTAHGFWKKDMYGGFTGLEGATNTDYTASQSNVKINYNGVTNVLKNNTTGVVKVTVYMCQCKDYTTSSPLDDFRVGVLDAYDAATANVVNGAVAETATASEIPQRLILNTAESHISIGEAFGVSGLEWKLVGKKKATILGPGDETILKYTKKNFTFSMDEYDTNAASTWFPGDILYLIKLEGVLCHDSLNHDKVQFSGHGLDCYRTTTTAFTYSDGKGVKDISTANTNTTTGFGTGNRATGEDPSVAAVVE